MEKSITNNSKQQENLQLNQSNQTNLQFNHENIHLEKLPELPPSPFLTHPQIITKVSSKSHPSNQKLIKFLISLSNFVFFGGSLAGLVVLIYQKYLFPKLKIRTERLRSLQSSTCKSYDGFLRNLGELVQSNSNLYQSSFIKIISKNEKKIKSDNSDSDRQAEKKLNHDSNQNLTQSQTDSTGNNPRSTSPNSIELQNTTNATHIPKNDTLERTLNTIDSSSPSSTPSISDNELPVTSDQVGDPNRTQLNQAIIHRLERITLGLRKRQEIQKEDEELNPLNQSEDIMYSNNIYRPNSESKTSSSSIKKLKESIKNLDDELDQQLEHVTLINQKLSTSHLIYSYGLNQWNTYSVNTRKSLDDDPYFIALNQFKTHIRQLKGTLLNRKKFY